MATARAHKSQNVGPRLGGPTMKQPNFNWEAEDRYNKLKPFRLEVNNIFKSNNTPQTEQLEIMKLARQEKPTIHRIINTDRSRKI